MIQLERIRTEVLKFGGYAMIGMMVIALYNLVDAVFVARLGKAHLAALSLVFPIGMGVSGIGFAFGSGSASWLSRLLGEGRPQRAREVLSSALFAAMVCGTVAIAVLLIWFTPLLGWFGGSREVLVLAERYGRIVLIGSFINIATVTLNHNLRAQGLARQSMLSMVFGSVVNIALDPLFIYGLQLGIRGAAVATVLAQTLSILLLVVLYRRAKQAVRPHPRSVRLEASLHAEVLKIGIPVFLYQALASAAMALLNNRAALYGESALAAVGAVNRILGFLSYLVYGFVKGLQPVAGYAYGRKDYGAVLTASRFTARFLGACCLLGTGFVLSLRGPIVGLFTDDPVVAGLAIRTLVAGGLTFCTLGFQMTCVTLFLALGRAREGALAGLSRQGIVFIPVVLIGHRLFGLNGVLYAQAISDLVVFALCTILWLRLSRMLNKARAEASQADMLSA